MKEVYIRTHSDGIGRLIFEKLSDLNKSVSWSDGRKQLFSKEAIRCKNKGEKVETHIRDVL